MQGDPFDQRYAEALQVGECPNWVETREVPWETKGGDGDHVVLLLSDTQWAPACKTRYERDIRKLITREAVQRCSQVEIQWDPEVSVLRFHSVLLWRDGQSRSFCDRNRMLLRQRESGLESQILNGRMSAIILLDDVRVGDVVEVSYTVETVKFLEGEKFDFFFWSERWAVTGRWAVSVRLPSGTDFRWKGKDEDKPYTTMKDGELVRYWEGSQKTSKEGEEGVPSWHSMARYVQVSGYGSWQEVAKVVSMNWAKLNLEDEAVLSQVRELVEGKETLSQKALALVRWVQDEVRYLGLEDGLGGLIPSEPAKVLARRFGDCKDKSVLLCALLRGIGVKSHPVLDMEAGRRWRRWFR